MAESIVTGRAPADWAMRASYEAESGRPFNQDDARCEGWVGIWRDSWSSAMTHAPNEATAMAEALEAKYGDHRPSNTGSSPSEAQENH